MQFRQKVVLYAIRGKELLVFDEPDFPEVGYQVPGGTVEPGERIEDAAKREWREETGASDTRAFISLGMHEYCYTASGRQHRHERHVFFVDGSNLDSNGWDRNVVEGIIDNLIDPEPGMIKTIRFRFSWMSLAEAERMLSFGFDEPLPILRAFLVNGAGAEP